MRWLVWKQFHFHTQTEIESKVKHIQIQQIQFEYFWDQRLLVARSKSPEPAMESTLDYLDRWSWRSYVEIENLKREIGILKETVDDLKETVE